MTPAEEAGQILELAGVASAGRLTSYSPIDGKPLGRVTCGDPDLACRRAAEAFASSGVCSRAHPGLLARQGYDRLSHAKPSSAAQVRGAPSRW